MESSIQETGRRLYAAAVRQGPLKSTSSFLAGRALHRRLLGQSMADERFKTQLLRFLDVYPSLQDPGDTVRHLRAYLARDGEIPAPIDRLLRRGRQRLPTWAAARLTEHAVQRMIDDLIAARDATGALPALRRLHRHHTGFSLHLLGESCLGKNDAEARLAEHRLALDFLANRVERWRPDARIDRASYGELPRVNISLKLSSLGPEDDPADLDNSRRLLAAALKPLFIAARDRSVFMNMELEHSDQRDLTYAVFEELAQDDDLRGYPHLGIVLQAYFKDSEQILQDLTDLARNRGTPLTVRLVKGAYLDQERIQAAQEHWPAKIFGSKAEVDRQFERLCGMLCQNWELTRPAIATHNLRSIAAALATAKSHNVPEDTVELQILHGIAGSIRRALVDEGCRVREYVPVGRPAAAMPYLIRRILESTSPDSSLRALYVEHQSADELLMPPEPPETTETMVPASAEPTAAAAGAGRFSAEPHTDFSLQPSRAAMRRALATIRGSLGREYDLLLDGTHVKTKSTAASVNPARPAEIIGVVSMAGREHADLALNSARAAFAGWRATPAANRADIMMRAASIMRERRFELAALEVGEVGKPWRDADADVAEAIDFLEYYGLEMLRIESPRQLSDIPGETDVYCYEPRGVAAVITPWNFPLAIPAGMISAALVSGNTVVFKPATSSAVLGYALVRIFHEAGVPGGVLGFLPGPGGEIGDYLAGDGRVDILAFTGSLKTGLSILEKGSRIVSGQRNIKKVIAELGGKNAIIVDADADLGLAVRGVVTSAFGYAGQKCSACSRVVVLASVYDQFVRQLIAATSSLDMGDPADPGAKLGPVINQEARDRILTYIERGKTDGRLVFAGAPPSVRPVARVVALRDDDGVAGGIADAAAQAEESDVPREAPATAEATVVYKAAVDRAADVAAAADVASTPDITDDAAAPADEPPGAEETAAAGQGIAAVENVPPEGTEPAVEVAEPGDHVTIGDSSAEQAGPEGFFIPAHIFAEVPPESPLAQEEIFGPVLVVAKAGTFSEALEMALAVPYGLTGGIYSRDPAHIELAREEFRVGNLYINRPITGAMVGRQPFGGSRLSGVGTKAGGPDYLLQFMESRTVTENTVRQGFAPSFEEGMPKEE